MGALCSVITTTGQPRHESLMPGTRYAGVRLSDVQALPTVLTRCSSTIQYGDSQYGKGNAPSADQQAIEQMEALKHEVEQLRAEVRKGLDEIVRSQQRG